MKIECLLDANSIIKYYVDLPGSDVINYLLEKSPSAIINITNIQIAEVVSLFYKFRREGVISSDEEREEFRDTFFNDIKTGKIIRYAFVDEHLLDFDVYDKITHIPPPKKSPIPKYIKFFGGFVNELKDIANTGDAIMLMIMREINLLADSDCYLVTCDGHVLEIAKALNLKTINPERIKVNDLPQSLDARKHKRTKKVLLKAICKDSLTKQPIGSTSSLDFCEGGICVRKLRNLTDGKSVDIKLSPISREEPVIECCGEVVWSSTQANAIKFLQPLSPEAYSFIADN